MTRERCQWDSKRYRPGLPHQRCPWSRDRCPFTHQAKHFERAPEIEATTPHGESPAIYARDGLWARALPGLYATQGSPPTLANLGLHVQRGGRRAAGDLRREVDACFFLLTISLRINYITYWLAQDCVLTPHPITRYLAKNSRTGKVTITRYLESETSSTHVIKVYILCIDRDMCVGETIMLRR